MKQKIHEIIFEADTPWGKRFDIVLLLAIVASVTVVLLESVDRFDVKYHTLFISLEWIFTFFFTIEYGLRLYAARRPMKYATSFFGIIDILALAPTYLSLLFVGSQYLLVIRSLRLMRIFRILKLVEFTREGRHIYESLKQSAYKIGIFLFFILMLVIIIGSIMYLIEGRLNNGFTDIPTSIYWAIVTITTVGYGDIAPITPLGKFLAAVVMLMGYSIIAVPTGIVTADLASSKRDSLKRLNTINCPSCTEEGHDSGAKFCKYCGEDLKVKF